MAFKCKPWLRCSCVLLVVVCAVALVCLCLATFVRARCSRGSFRRAAVAADSKLCSEIGKSMLEQGGSAADGAIAALLCTSVVNPQSAGIGGGSIVLVKNETGGVTVYNFRETVPKTFKTNLLNDCPTTFRISTGGQWIGVPGELLGYKVIHQRHGKLPWEKLFEPTIKLAREGIPMPPFLARFMSSPLVKNYVENSSLCEVFCNNNKTVLKEGDTLRLSILADTLEAIAFHGVDAFYNGRIGQALIRDIKAAGGTLEMEDLRSFKVQEEGAWTVPLGDTQMHVPPPPAGGALLAFVLQIMKGFSLTSDSQDGEKKIQMYHQYAEALKFTNGQKKSIYDPGFKNTLPTADRLIDPSFADHIRKMITSNGTHENSYYNNIKPPPDHLGTSHVSVLDENGMAVSATSTINQLFGGAVYSRHTGIVLNNELADFCHRTNTVKAGERPPSSMTPVILESKSGRIIVIGGSGGSMITSAMALSLINRLWLGMSLKDSIAAPIIFVDSQNKLNFEPQFDESVKKGLTALGHKVGTWPYFFNVVNGLEKENGCIEAVSDRRKMGVSAGF
ncbi:gamma-glutamyltransferase 5 [Austrofundulus limnaeus]|uniref:Glutathione hydrolase n=1 Tax=Austrofundulus limnaeus TaxID=52670 RepID=A0A2I4AUR5_AUSLI|nr:PREDICTED: gamma-glutamyltransferase 5-like [Austrofundulus limnaeus]